MSPPTDASGAPSTSPEQYVLAVDLGTGGPKVAVVSTAGRVVAHATEPVALHLLDGGGAEQDPHEWWSAICAASRRALGEAGVAAEDMIGVGCTAQWSGTVAVGADGSPLMAAIIWMDSRGNQAIRKVAGGAVNVLGYDPRKILRWVQVTGGAPGLSGKDPVSHILFIRDTFPDVYRRTATFLEPVDYLNLKMTGRTCASFDSIAAHWVTDNRNIDRVTYDDRLLEITGLERSKLPDLVPPGTIVGHLTAGPARNWVCRRVCPCRWGRVTCIRPCSGRGLWPTTRPTCTSAPRRGFRATCPSKDGTHIERGLHSGRSGRPVRHRRRARDRRGLPHLPSRQPGVG